MKLILLSSLFLFVAGCTSTPTPTGDRIVSVSWVNRTPVAYRLIETSVCSRQNGITLDGLPPYSERAVQFETDIVRNCQVKVIGMVGSRTLPSQSNWIPAPSSLSKDRKYHLRITLTPASPPHLVLEPAASAVERIESAGRRIEQLEE
jgi:hypothetical protein